MTSTRTLTKIAAALLLALALLVAASACGGAATESSPAPSASTGAAALTDVTLIMDWMPWVLDIPVDVAQEKGFYADRGLKVEQVLPAGVTDVVKFVSTGKAQFGLYYAPDTLMAVGEGAPLISVGSLMSHAPVGIAMAPGVRASSPKGLAGKTVAVPLIPSTRASFATMLKAAGMDAGSVKVADPGFELVAPLLAGKFPAVAVTEFGELVQAEAEGQKLDYLDFRDWGTPDFAFLNMIAEKGFAARDPETVKAFVAATLAGLEYATLYPDEAVGIYVARHPELKADLLLAQWKAAAPSMAAPGTHVAGWQDPASWQALNEWMVQSGLLKEPVDAAGVVDNTYLPAQ
jgi:putative hydroxymethylpyrimidine transport system substrate-binding protein